jgi:hypothetical protein
MLGNAVDHGDPRCRRTTLERGAARAGRDRGARSVCPVGQQSVQPQQMLVAVVSILLESP